MTPSPLIPRPNSALTRNKLARPRLAALRELPVVHRRGGAGDHARVGPARVIVTFTAVLAALAGTGAASAPPGRAPRLPAMARNVLEGAVAMGVTHSSPLIRSLRHLTAGG
jgi:hypothetical protein